ncbi:hypothetical protein P1P70_44935, partial [Streptomyces sp. MB09-02B]|nr:hypothetical protein [Streptomyces sp. MB09-02B]
YFFFFFFQHKDAYQISACLGGSEIFLRDSHLPVPGDLGTPPRRDHADRLAALDDDAWGRLRLAPGWTDVPDRAEEEVHTP